MTTDTPFHDLDAYLALPRLGGLVLSPDGARLVTTVQTLNPDRTAYSTALWELDPAGERPARRLTRSAKGEASAAFTRHGDLLFTSARPDPDAPADGQDEARPALWLLPAGGGEARVIASAPGGLSGPLAAREADVVSVAASVLPGADDLAADAGLRKARKKAKVQAILHTSYPVRHWDRDLGPDQARRFVADLAAAVDAPAAPLPPPEGEDAPWPAPGTLPLRQLTGAGRHLLEHSATLSADGATLVTSWGVAAPGAAIHSTLVAIDTASGERRTLVDQAEAEAHAPAISPDGSQVAFLRETVTTPEHAPVVRLALVPIAGGEVTVLADDWDRWPTSVAWLPDSSGLVVTADSQGRGPIYLVTLGESTTVEQVTAADAAFTDVQVSPDGGTLYALRVSYAAPAEPVRIDLAGFRAGGEPGSRPPVGESVLPAPTAPPTLPGRLEELVATAPDGVGVRGWLALPQGAGPQAPAPLLVWIHGGPLNSWNAWSWRWNPWLMVAAGYAVLLPDPALSTGYGQDFVQRGWGRWGSEPYTDLLAITDAAVALPEIDRARTAAMGGSFGGYMANWVAGHTDRFAAIVTHASLWALDQFGPTTDHSYYWQREMTPEMAVANSPHRFVGNIRTPMLVIHGDRDYRVPIGEGLRLWFELLTASGLPAAPDGSTVHRFLYFPDENHWVLSPQHAKVWYQTVLAFLSEHVLGEPAELPATLG